MRVTILFAVLVSACAAQSVTLQGELVSRKLTDRGDLRVRLERSGPEWAETAFVTPEGSFSFHSIQTGSYLLKVLAADGDEVLTEFINVNPTNLPISIKLPELPADRPTGETVSVARLLHKPDSRAFRGLVQAQKFSESGDYSRAAEALEHSVARDPDYAEARINLGAQYVRLHRYQEAVAQFERAIALDPSCALAQANMAVALQKLGRTAEAERWARSAVQLDPANATSHYILACVLAAIPDSQSEALKHMEIAARTLPLAQKVLNAFRSDFRHWQARQTGAQ